MRLSELLISIGIFAIAVSTTFGAYTGFIKNSNRLEKVTLEADTVLMTDMDIRRKIQSINIPYWHNANTDSQVYLNLLKQSEYRKGVYIVKTESLKNGNGVVKGIKTTWNYENKTYETKELFSSNSLLGKSK